jgi:hypothetical protein
LFSDYPEIRRKKPFNFITVGKYMLSEKGEPGWQAEKEKATHREQSVGRPVNDLSYLTNSRG